PTRNPPRLRKTSKRGGVPTFRECGLTAPEASGTPPRRRLVRPRSALPRSLITARRLHVLVATRPLEILVPSGALEILVPSGALVVLVPSGALVVLVPSGALIILVPPRRLHVLVPPRGLDVLVLPRSWHGLVVDHRGQGGKLRYCDHHAEHCRCHFPHHTLLSGPLHASGPLHFFRRDSEPGGARKSKFFFAIAAVRALKS